MSSDPDDAPTARPSKRFAFDADYDFSYRPSTYWTDLPTENSVIGEVKGTVRRDAARRLLDHPEPDAPEGLGDFLLTPDLGEAGKDLWGRLDPANLGGEFLPDSLAGEVEIARVELASVTGDVCQILARLDGDGCIHYRVVDEYWDEGVTYSVSQETSKEPLTLGELIEFIDNSEREDESHAGGLVECHREYLYEEEAWIESPAELAHFATVSSHFYPMLTDYYAARAEEWVADLEAEREAEIDDWLGKYRDLLNELTEAAQCSPSDPAELPDDLRTRAQALLIGGNLEAAERICDELGDSSYDLRVMIAIKRGDSAEAIRLVQQFDIDCG